MIIYFYGRCDKRALIYSFAHCCSILGKTLISTNDVSLASIYPESSGNRKSIGLVDMYIGKNYKEIVSEDNDYQYQIVFSADCSEEMKLRADVRVECLNNTAVYVKEHPYWAEESLGSDSKRLLIAHEFRRGVFEEALAKKLGTIVPVDVSTLDYIYSCEEGKCFLPVTSGRLARILSEAFYKDFGIKARYLKGIFMRKDYEYKPEKKGGIF